MFEWIVILFMLGSAYLIFTLFLLVSQAQDTIYRLSNDLLAVRSYAERTRADL